MAAPRKNPPNNAADEIQTLAATGCSVVGIATHFGVGDELLARWIEDYPALKQAFKAGRERERHALHNALYVQAVDKGNAAAAMFLLKARHGYREGDQSDNANRVAITFNLPGALSAEQYALAKAAKVKVIDGNADSTAKWLPTLTTERS
jgi:hypothetical protein